MSRTQLSWKISRIEMLKFLSPLFSQPCAYHHSDHFPCVISLPAPHVYTQVVIFFFFSPLLFQNQLKSFRLDCNLNSWGKTSEWEQACPGWMQHCCWPVKSGSALGFWGCADEPLLPSPPRWSRAMFGAAAMPQHNRDGW